MTWRVVWLAGLVSHGYFLWLAWQEWPNAFASVALLAVTVVFFTLKALDVPFLRCRLRPGGFLALVIVVALLHAGAIPELSADDVVKSFAVMPLEALALQFARKLLLVAPILALILPSQRLLQKIFRPGDEVIERAVEMLMIRKVGAAIRCIPLRAPPSSIPH